MIWDLDPLEIDLSRLVKGMEGQLFFQLSEITYIIILYNNSFIFIYIFFQI